MRVREQLHDALDIEDFPRRSLVSDTMSQLERPHGEPHRLRLAPALATLIAGALILTLVAVRLGMSSDIGSPLPAATTIDNLVDYRFVSTSVGWVHVYRGGDIIARSSDGGHTWRRVLKVEGLYPDARMQAVSETNATLVGYGPSGAVVWVTSDGGAHWRSTVVATSDPSWLTGASGYFLNERLGWLLLARANCGALMACIRVPESQLAYRTTDGGDHWTYVGASDQRAAGLALQFVSANVGVAVGGSTVAATHDGGRTWKVTVAPVTVGHCVAPASCSQELSQTVTMFNEMNGVLVASAFRDYVLVSRVAYATQDGGLTWTESPMLLRNMGGLVLFLAFNTVLDFEPSAIPVPTGWHLATAQYTDVTHNWVSVTNSPEQAALGIRHADDLFQVLASTDGGVHWHPVPLPRV